MIRYNGSENVKPPKLYRNSVSGWIRKVAQKYGKIVGDINYIFCDDIKILEINKKFLKHDYYTDVITFDYSVNDTISGDIFISLETVESNAKDYSVSFENELRRVMIHGILHLCGQNDQTPEEKQEMRHKEDIALRLI